MHYRINERLACEESLKNFDFQIKFFEVFKFVIDIKIWSIDLLYTYVLILTLLKKIIVAL